MLPVFDLKPLKREFYNKLFLAFLFVTAGFVIVAFDVFPVISLLVRKTTFFVLIGLLIAFQMWHNNQIKKRLETAIATTDMDEKFNLYRQYYKWKIFYSVADVAINSVFFIITGKIWFLFLNLMPMAFLLFSFPRKTLIALELKNDEIEVVG